MKLETFTSVVCHWVRKWKVSGYLALLLFAQTSVAIPQESRAAQKTEEAPRIANFVDIAEKAGLSAITVFGGVDTKKYIIETTGNGLAIFDYDNDGWPDIFVVNGTMLWGLPEGAPPTNHLYH